MAIILRLALSIRDPFILPLPEVRRYALFGTSSGGQAGGGFDAYLSVGTSLDEWEGPIPAFRPAPGFWATREFWAPEVHKWCGRYYLFGTFKSPDRARGTQILVSDAPTGPFAPVSPGPVTPLAWECLDGTFFVDDVGKPWLVFCHEWLQASDGGMYAMPLREDLSGADGGATLLFNASEAPWTRPITHAETTGYVTDGPFLHRGTNGTLGMLWSSFGADGYAVGWARSGDRTLTGAWTHDPEPIFARDGGHAMLFRGFDDVLYITFHEPNGGGKERAIFRSVEERGGAITLTGRGSAIAL